MFLFNIYITAGFCSSHHNEKLYLRLGYFYTVYCNFSDTFICFMSFTCLSYVFQLKDRESEYKKTIEQLLKEKDDACRQISMLQQGTRSQF